MSVIRRKWKLAMLIGALAGVLLTVAPIASAHTPTLVASLDCNGNVSWTFSSNGYGASFTISDGASGQQGGSMTISAPQYSTSGSYTVPLSVTSGTVTVHITWDDNYTGVTAVTVSYSVPKNCKSSPTISTSLSPSAITVGSSAHDSATLSGASTHAGGSVAYSVYPSLASCVAGTGGTTAGTMTVTNAAVPNSDAVSFPTAGSYYWQAVYSGDASNVGASSPCSSELLVVSPASPTMTTQASPAAVVPADLTDTATLSGASAGATGTISFHLYSDSDCSTEVAGSPKTASVNGNGSYTSSPAITVSNAGSYFWRDSYSGDSNNNSIPLTACGAQNESTVVSSKTVSISTTVVPAGPVSLGASAHDTATLTGATNDAGGTVSYALYSDNTCGTAIANLTPTANSVVNGVVPASNSFTFTSAGTFFFVATYSGDANNTGPVSSGCAAEPLTVNKAATATVTNIKQGGSTVTSIGSGTSVTDVATVSGQVGSTAPTGTVSFSFFANATCTGTSTSAGAPQLSGGSATSNSEGPLAAGNYSFLASYSGDANYVASTGACEPLTVTSPPPPVTPGTPAIGITKNPKTQSIASGATANFTIVVTNTGSLVLTNVSVSDPLSPNCNQTSAGIPALASMAPGASVTYNCSLAGVTAGFTNVATATGTGSNGQTVTATDSAPVTVQAITPPVVPTPKPTPHPAIGIVKDPKSQTIGQGGTADFTITVTNTGDVTLTDVTVTDPLSPNCDRSLGTLAVGQSKHYTCSKANVNSDFENVATATGKPPTTATVKATDHAQVTVKPFIPPQHPRIAIVKSPKTQTLVTSLTTVKNADGSSKTTVTYGTAKFTIKVTNTGDVALHSVNVTDPASPGCDKTIGALAPDASKTYTCTRSTVRSNFTNVATAHGTSPKGVKVMAVDHANVKVKVRAVDHANAKVKVGKAKTKVKTTSTSPPAFTG